MSDSGRPKRVAKPPARYAGAVEEPARYADAGKEGATAPPQESSGLSQNAPRNEDTPAKMLGSSSRVSASLVAQMERDLDQTMSQINAEIQHSRLSQGLSSAWDQGSMLAGDTAAQTLIEPSDHVAVLENSPKTVQEIVTMIACCENYRKLVQVVSLEAPQAFETAVNSGPDLDAAVNAVARFLMVGTAARQPRASAVRMERVFTTSTPSASPTMLENGVSPVPPTMAPASDALPPAATLKSGNSSRTM